MNEERIIMPTAEIAKADGEVNALTMVVSSFTIEKAEDFTSAGEFLQQVKGKMDALDKMRKDITAPLDNAKKRIMDLFNGPINKLKLIEQKIKGAMVVYQNIEEEKARKQREEAEKIQKEEAEKIRAQAAAETDQAKKAELVNDAAMVEFSAAPAVQATKVEGISFVEKWTFKITNEAEIPRDYLIIDEKKLGKLATATKGSMKIPGVAFYSEKVVSARKGLK